MSRVGSIRELAEAYLELHEPAERLSLEFGGFRVLVRTNSAALKAKLADYFRDFSGRDGDADATIHALETEPPEPACLGMAFTAKQPDPGKTRIKEEFADLPDGRVVRKRLTGMVFLFGNGLHVALGPCLDNDNQVVNFINNRFIEHHLSNGCRLFHAAGVARDGQGLAMAGFSGMGKSTLALHVMARGDGRVAFVSNDRLMVERDGGGLCMHGVAKMPRINPGTVLNNPALAPVMDPAERERFAALPLEELWGLEHKYDAFIDQCFGPGRFRLTTPMTGLVLLNWKLDGGPLSMRRVELSDRPDLMPAFMKSTGLFYDPDSGREQDVSAEAYLELLDGCPVWEFSGGVDFPAAADKCVQLLEG